MKKIILILFCFYSFTSFAQDFNKGHKLIGGSFSFSVFNANSAGVSYHNAGNVGILPSYSWFVKNNLAMGIRGNIGFSRTETRYDNGDTRTNRSLNTGIAVFLKKYRSFNEKFGMYVEHEVGGNYSVYKERHPSMPVFEYKLYGANYKLSPGLFYRFSKRFMGEGNIGGAFASYHGGQGTRNFGIGATFLQNFNLGINYVIEKKKPG